MVGIVWKMHLVKIKIKKIIMKNLFNIIICFFSINSFAQIIVGEFNNASANKTSVLLDFERSNNRGILLPAVNSTADITEKGTIVLDASTATTAQFKIKKNNGWFNYSNNNGNATAITNNRPSIVDYPTAKLVLGAETSSIDGALILESSNKVMVLPIVKTVDNIINPSPGMMVFVNKETCLDYNTPCIDQFLAFYNGTEWSFWEYNL